MTEKVILGYDPHTGDLSDATGVRVGSWLNVNSFDPSELSRPLSTEALTSLKAAGFEVDEIIAMHKAGVV